MRKLTRYLLWLFVFSLPWGIVDSLPGVGTINRLLGLTAILAGALTTVAEGRIRKPGTIFWFALVFGVSGVLSLLWTISYTDSTPRAGTYIQMVGLVWVVREFARTRQEQHWLLLAFCLGALRVAFDLLVNFSAGVAVQSGEFRFSGSGTSPNYASYTLVIGFLMAWHLFLQHRGAVRVIAAGYCLVSPVAVMLTASRTAVVAGFVALSIVPITLRRESFSAKSRIVFVLLVAAVAISLVVPRKSWDRVLSTWQEVEVGTMGARTDVWDVGWRVFLDRPFLGAGVGAFPVAAQALKPIFGRTLADTAHNMVLSLLVEQGVVGLFLFAGLLAACARIIVRQPSPDRQVWIVLMVTFLVFGITSDAHADKVIWLLFGLLAAQDSVKTGRPYFSEHTVQRVKAGARGALLRPEPARPIASSSPRL